MLIERPVVAADGRVRRALRGLTGAGHDVLLLHRGAEADEPALRGDGGRRGTVLPGGAAGRALERVPWPLRRAVLLARFAWLSARERPDVVHAHDLSMLAPAWLAARATGAALVYDTHEYATDIWYLGPAGRRVARVLERLLAPRCDAVVAVSPQTAERLAARYTLRRAPVVVRNAPALDWAGAPGAATPVRDLRAELGVGDAPLILHQGAAGAGRGVVEVVAALPRLPGAHLLQLGDTSPESREEILAAARRAGVADRVHVLGGVPVEVLLAHTRQADLGVSLLDPRWLNHRLTLPNKVLEYAAAGLPAVVSEGTASGELVQRLGVGWTVPHGDGEALVRTLAAALAGRRDPGLGARLDRAARETTWDAERPSLLALYDALDSHWRPGARLG